MFVRNLLDPDGRSGASADAGRQHSTAVILPRVPTPERHVLVCLNARPPGNPKGSCAEKGSESLADRLKALVRERGLGERVIVSRTSCLKHCSHGITVAVQPDNVWYGGVAPGDLDEICESHLEKGRPVERLLMPDIPWE
jgi:(2Fe-2S) ferredoxin